MSQRGRNSGMSVWGSNRGPGTTGRDWLQPAVRRFNLSIGIVECSKCLVCRMLDSWFGIFGSRENVYEDFYLTKSWGRFSQFPPTVEHKHGGHSLLPYQI